VAYVMALLDLTDSNRCSCPWNAKGNNLCRSSDHAVNKSGTRRQEDRLPFDGFWTGKAKRMIKDIIIYG
jgi:hypothetical protein